MAPVVDTVVCKEKLQQNKSISKRTVHVSKNGAVDKKPNVTDDDGKNDKWFEDRGPGDGSSINSFPAITQKSLANDLDKPAKKSWYEIVEEDENEEQKPPGEKMKDDGAVAKIKQEKIEQANESNEKEDKKVPLIAKIKVEKGSEIIINKEKDAIESTAPKAENVLRIPKEPLPLIKKEESTAPNTENLLPILKQECTEVKMESVGLKREREVKSSFSSDSDSDIKEKRTKHQKQGRRSQRIAATLPASPEPTLDKEPSEEEPTVSAEDLKLARLTSMRKRNRDASKDGTRNKRERNHSTSTDNSSESRKFKLETDPATLSRRQKQIDFGKNTVGYDRYRAQIPKDMRTNLHPRTPPKNRSYSRRAWDGMVKIWRQQLHIWDPPGADGEGDTMSEISTTNSSCNLSDGYTSTSGSYDDGQEDCLDLGQE